MHVFNSLITHLTPNEKQKRDFTRNVSSHKKPITKEHVRFMHRVPNAAKSTTLVTKSAGIKMTQQKREKSVWVKWKTDTKGDKLSQKHGIPHVSICDEKLQTNVGSSQTRTLGTTSMKSSKDKLVDQVEKISEKAYSGKTDKAQLVTL